MAFMFDIGLFALKTLLIVASIILVLIVVVNLFSGRGKARSQIEVEKLNTRFRSFRRHLQGHLLSKKGHKALVKKEKREAKQNDEPKAVRLFVLDFNGDIRASEGAALKEEITAILSVAKPGDEVVVRLESGGGLVTSYGLAAAQLARLKAHQVRLTITVDKIAASGGYMMACVADKILCAPFAVVGSIGVIAQVPNFNRLLKRHDVDYREVTAGEFKRTVTVFGEITESGMEKFKSQIEATHTLFKDFIKTHRPKVDIARVSTGEHWYGSQALELGLVDELTTSDEYLFKHFDMADVYRVQYHAKKKLMDRLGDSVSGALGRAALKLFSELEASKQ